MDDVSEFITVARVGSIPPGEAASFAVRDAIVAVFNLNGTYHGIYQLHERPMHHYLDKYFGGDPEDYHYTNSGRTGSDHGGGDSWNATWQQVKSAAATGGLQSKEWINWESLADNQLLYFYFGNDWDWTTTHNWMAAGPQRPRHVHVL